MFHSNAILNPSMTNRFGFTHTNQFVTMPNLFLVAPFGGEDILSVACDGSTTVFSTLPGFGNAYNRNIAIVPRESSFTAGDIYATEYQYIYKIPVDGSSPIVFASGFLGDMSITFDRIGTFGGDMIVAVPSDSIYRISPSGDMTLIAADVADIKEPTVTPLSFGTYGGQIWVVNTDNNFIDTVAANGTLTSPAVDLTSFGFNAGHSAAFVKGGSGGPPAAIFSTLDSSLPYGISVSSSSPTFCDYAFFISSQFVGIFAYPASTFPNDCVVVTSSFGDVGVITWNGSSYDLNLAFSYSGESLVIGVPVLS